MLVEHFMTVDVFTVTLEMTVRESIELLTTKRISGAPVVGNSGVVVSVISEGDLLKLAAAGKLHEPIAKCLDKLVPTAQLVTLKKSSTFVEAYRTFLSASVHRLLVTDGSGKLQGIVSRSNLLRMLIEDKTAADSSLPKTDVA